MKAYPVCGSREEALVIIEELRKEYGERAERLLKANEAKTRLLLVDRILCALGWSPDDFNPETPVRRNGYTDYLLSVDGIPRLIVEAKRVGHTFGPPRSRMLKTDYSLKYVQTAYGPAFTEVLKQAERYAQESRVAYAVVTNGAEWALIQIIPLPGQDVDDLRCFYFGNLLSSDSHLELLWTILSKLAVGEGSLEEHLARLNLREVDFSVAPRAQIGDLSWQKTNDAQLLDDFYYLFFDDITDPGRRKMLERCFVTNAQLDQYEGELKRALRDTTPCYAPDAVDISPADRRRLLASESGDQKGRVILVTGSVGCGKTTLVTKVLVEGRQERGVICLVIDLIDEVANEQVSIASMLWKYLLEEWKRTETDSSCYESLQKIFGRELSELRQGPRAKVFEHDEQEFMRCEADLLDRLSSEPEEFLPACWRYYQQKGKGIAIFIDNVDRASEDYQQQVYAFAHKLAHRTGATVVVTMREVTFFRGRESGFLDVRSSDTVFHLQMPDLVQLLSKRIKYVEHSMDEDHRVSKWRSSSDWDSFQSVALQHAKTLKETFLTSEDGKDALGLLAAMAWHDVRLFLRILHRLHSMLGDTGESWVLSEIVAALMTPANTGDIPMILSNIYRPPYATYPCYYLKIRVLLMMRYGRKAHETRRGISLPRILSFARVYGYQERWARRAIEEMVRERLLECLEVPAEADYTKEYELVRSHTFRPSPLALMLLEQVGFEPIYLCLIGNDLPFHKKTAFEQYVKALQAVLEVLDRGQLERTAVGFLTDTVAGRVVAQYLVGAFSDEQPAETLVSHIPEVAAAESRLSSIVQQLRDFAGVSSPPMKRYIPSSQPPLFELEGYQNGLRLTDFVEIPQTVCEARIGTSSLGPLILWALVALRAAGQLSASGMEIASVINEYLADEHNRKEPTNVSRALRSKTLRSQKWLVTKGLSRKKRFALADGWEHHWMEIFGESAPDVD